MEISNQLINARLTATAKWAYCVLQFFHTEGRPADMKALEKACWKGRAAIEKALDELERSDWIQRVRTENGPDQITPTLPDRVSVEEWPEIIII